MLKTSKDALLRAFPKTGTFFAVYQDCDTEPKALDAMTSRVHYSQIQYTWHNGGLYEDISPNDCVYEIEWALTNVEDEVDYLHEEAVAIGFIPIPEARKVFL